MARKVLDHPMLSMVVGNGATEFAANCGFPLEENSALLSDKTMKAYEVFVVTSYRSQLSIWLFLAGLC